MGQKIAFFVLMLLLFSCSKQYEVDIHNNTNHLLYAAVDSDDQVVIAGNETYTINLGDETNLPFDEIRKTADLHLQGETFVMYQGDNETFSTTIEVRPDKTYHVHANPTHASVKLVNLSDVTISSFNYRKTTIFDSNTYQLNGNIAVGDSVYARLPYPTIDNQFTLDFIVYIDDYLSYEYTGYELGIDEQARIEFQIFGGKENKWIKKSKK